MVQIKNNKTANLWEYKVVINAILQNLCICENPACGKTRMACTEPVVQHAVCL